MIKCKCGNETNETDGICRICKLFRNKEVENETKQSQTNGGEKMAITGIKICENCKKEYKPTGNFQRRCSECKEKNKPEIKKQYDKNYREKKKYSSGITKPPQFTPSPDDKSLSLMDIVNQINKYVRDTIAKDIQPLIDELKKNITNIEAKLKGF